MRLLAALLALSFALSSNAAAQGLDREGDFDFYVLALTWSPTWCAAGDGRSPQCRPGTGFVIHGLWPQYERGFPQDCPSDYPQRIPTVIADGVADLMPDRRLFFSQWRNHGTCTGLSPQGYAAAIRRAARAVSIPISFTRVVSERSLSAGAAETAFSAANPGLTGAAMAVSCDDGRLAEMRICLTRDFAFRPCPEVDRRGCSAARIVLPQSD